MFHHENHAAVEANSFIMVGMFVCCVFASQKPSERQFFVPAKMDIAVKLLIFISVCVDLSSGQGRLFPILRLTKACWMYPPPLGT